LLKLGPDELASVRSLGVGVEEGVTVDHDHVGSLADGGVVDSGGDGIDRTNWTIVSESSELTTGTVDGIDHLRSCHVMVVDTLIFDREEPDQAPVTISILIESRLEIFDDLAEVFAVTLVAHIRADHQLLIVLDSVLYGKWDNVTTHAVDAHNLVVPHFGEFIGNLLVSLAARIVLRAGERVVRDANRKATVVLCLDWYDCS
jgi:hypothetical protein